MDRYRIRHSKYDGSNWTVFNTANSGLPDNAIWSLSIDNHYKKWIGTNNGMAKLTISILRAYKFGRHLMKQIQHYRLIE